MPCMICQVLILHFTLCLMLLLLRWTTLADLTRLHRPSRSGVS